MSGELIDYSIERQRHEGFVGRLALLDRLDQLLIEDGTDRWVVVTGGPGMGKSALLAAWLARREAAGAVVPHHFIRRGQYNWDDPTKLVGSLVAQIEQGFPGLNDPGADRRMDPAARLGATLARAPASDRTPASKRLVVLIDGLDEYDPPAGAKIEDPLAAFLPHALPRGVSFLCASRPRHPYVDMLAARDGALTQLDLDERDLAADNEATVRAFWDRAAPDLGLDAQFIHEAVARAGGNLQHAAMLRQHLRGLPSGQRRVEDIPRGLAVLVTKSWQRIATEPIVVHGLGLLCAAREPLTLDELGAVAGWTNEAPRQVFVRGARELLLETRRPDGCEEYRLHHDSIRAHIAKVLGATALRGHHSALARWLATWPAPREAMARRYALRHGLVHRTEAGEWTEAWRLAADTSFVEAKCRELGAHEVEADVARAARHCRASGDDALCGCFDDLGRALARESHWLRAAPEAAAALVWNQLRRLGWSADRIDQELRIPDSTRFLRLRHVATRESSVLARNFIGHTGSVRACAVTPDSRRLISASNDKTLKVWDLATGQVLATLRGHADWMNACTVTPDGRHAVSASWDKTLRVWDLASGQILANLQGHADWVNACAVTPDGLLVISASEDKTLKVWDLATGQVRATLQGHTSWVNACAVTPDGGRVVSASDDRTLRVWDLATGQVLATLQGHASSVNACTSTPDGRCVVSASEDKTLKVWDLATGRVLATLQGHLDWVSACAVSPDGRRVVSASADKTLKVWNLATGQMLATLQGHARVVNACVVTPDGRCVVSASDDETLKVWDLATGQALATMQGHASWVNACAVTPDGGHVLSASSDQTLKVWDLATGQALATLQGHADKVRGCAVTPDGGRVVSASDDQTLKVSDLATGQTLATLRGHSDRVRACAVASDGECIVSASDDQTLKVWDLATGQVIASLRGHASSVKACAVTPDGRCVISASDDQTLRIWDLATGQVRAALHGHAARLHACAATPDGKGAVSASEDQTLKVWDLATGQLLATLRGHVDSVRGCAVTPDGRRVVSASDDQTLKVWDLASGVCTLTHRGSSGYTAVAATETAIIAGDATGAVWFLDVPPSSWRVTSRPASRGSESERAIFSESELSPPKSPTQKHTILFLAANPSETGRLALDREAWAVQRELESVGYRDRFELVTRWAAQPLDLLRELRKLKPTVVHFSGHGVQETAYERRSGRGARRDIVVGDQDVCDGECRHGLFFQGADGRAQFVSAQAIEQTFGAAGASVKLVVLNACYTDVQAEALRAHVDCVVGIRGGIEDDAARSFAIGFYGGLGERESVEAAYKQGRAAISLDGLRNSDHPQLKVRPGVDAARLVLAADPR